MIKEIKDCLVKIIHKTGSLLLLEEECVCMEDIGNAIGSVFHNLSEQDKKDFMSGFNHELLHQQNKN